MILSNLGKTYIFDLDGTLVVHNGYKNGNEKLLPSVHEFFSKHITKEDSVIIITARTHEYRDQTIRFLQENNIKFDHIIFELPHGERLLFNDRKNSGLNTAYSINLDRNNGLTGLVLEISDEL